LFKHWMCNGYT